MNQLEQFKAVYHFEKPDYYPIFGNQGAPGFSMGVQLPEHKKLLKEGMPSLVHGFYNGTDLEDVDTWQQYWGSNQSDYFGLFSGL